MIVMFVDLAGFTALTEAHGDEAASQLLEGFCRVVRDIVRRHDLREVKTIGDAFLLTADNAAPALSAAEAIVRKMSELDGYPDVRIGIHQGEVLERDGDVFGKTVNLAARVAAEASAGQILVTREVIEAEGRDDAPSVGTRRLRNIPREVELFELGERPAERHRDAVCHMMLSPASVVGTYEHRDTTYRFCSKDCLVAFVESPEAYVESVQ